MTYLCFDLETNTKTMHGRKANFLYNDIVAAGYKNSMVSKTLYSSDKELIVDNIPNDVKELVGHNIRFDLLYIWKVEKLQYMLKNGLKVWDTQLAHYFLSGQKDKYPALRDIAVNKYGCDERPKVMEEYWKNGVDTCEIPQDLVLHDVLNDVIDTESIYLQQLQEAEECGMLDYIEAQMDFLLAMTEAEYNGIKVNREVLHKNKILLEEELQIKTVEFLKNIEQRWTEIIPFSITNPGHLSTLLFGGSLKHFVVEPVINELGELTLIKSGINKGTVKTKKIQRDIVLKGLELFADPEKMTAREGVYETNEDALELVLVRNRSNKQAREIIEQILYLRGLNKQISTYYIGTEECLYNDDLVHPVFNHTSTETGRLSSTKPNAQNQPSAEDSLVLQHFVSRFKGGKIISADYSQIEIVVQAELSCDKRYQQDVLDGVDFHCMRLGLKERVPYADVIHYIKTLKDPIWISKRKAVKVFSFQRSYGAGKVKISASTGMSEEEVAELIKIEDLTYDGLKRFNDKLKEIVEFTAEKIPGSVYKEGYYKFFMGKKYYFKEYNAPKFMKERGIAYSFKPQQIKNYGIQGTAFDVAAIMLGRLWREKLIHNREKYLLINMVHDSFMLDCKAEYISESTESLQDLTRVKEMCSEVFGYNWTLPIKIEVKAGESWYEC